MFHDSVSAYYYQKEQSKEESQKNTFSTYPVYYKILGISKNTTNQEIKAAYRKYARQYHPDKCIHLGKEFQDFAIKMFREITEAYQKIKIERKMN